MKRTYHCHTNFGIYDGRNSAFEMISKAKDLGFEEIGISNHFCYNKNILKSGMSFNDLDKAIISYENSIKDIRLAAQKVEGIKVHIGCEFDFFNDKAWLTEFPEILDRLKNIGVEYFIGAVHYFSDLECKHKFFNAYHNNRPKPKVAIEEIGIDVYIKNWFETTKLCIKSQKFDFIAHLDLIKLFDFYDSKKWQEEMEDLIDCFIKYNQPYELNTSGWNKGPKEQHPSLKTLEKLKQSNIPILVNDDAHETSQLGQYFERAEKILKEINYKNFWSLNKQ